MKAAFHEIQIHHLFRWSLWLKAVFAVGEIAGGVATALASQDLAISLANLLTGYELVHHPEDVVANYLQHAAHQFVGIRHFAALYLLTHGVVKMWLIVELLRERISFYPIALLAFSVFVTYQLYRFRLTHSWLLLLITLLDLVVIWLTWKEYQFLQGHGIRL
ncbi:MAG TPA: DUF2127 domain-containing protein [Noviherbaspirillum sp.]|uniref:DUF2127 domain-containing protein n=1 Tax=Noviherbaspirillum sp. TaxID=1926288 RepID=UPI002B45BB23|nr:DUF2127 domain-containing protein [Noviherbaspirillum sp.]HJV84101.1 DUF2127 domain-containing protein [Noviherbaspirillum sp.]